MKLITHVHKNFAQYFWNLLPSYYQKVISHALAKLYSAPLSKFFVKPFARKYKMSLEELSMYAPGSGAQKYLSFQDFFTRQRVAPVQSSHPAIFPCEGMVCESGRVSDLGAINVKGNLCDVRRIFGDAGARIPDSHFFINIFLHNHNYHRFHAPVSGEVKSLTYIQGQLNFLRPWLYMTEQVSEPAFLNERVVVEIEDDNNQLWFLSFVGGMGVGKIKLHSLLQRGARLNCGDELGLFLLGSTCCLAAPLVQEEMKYHSRVRVGDPL